MNSISFVTGKGGVGKTRLSLLLSQKNPRAILAETSEDLKEEAEILGIKRVAPIYRFSRADLAEEFLTSTLKIATLAKWLSRSSIFQTLLQLAPNLHELLLLKKWAELAEEQPLIVDAPSTGNFIGLFEAIETARSLFDGGSLKSAAEKSHSLLEEAKYVEVYIVSLPEKSSLLEMDQIALRLKELYPGLRVHRVLNRLHKVPEISKENLSISVRELAFERPAREKIRIEPYSFDFSLAEGATKFEEGLKQG